MIKSLLYQHILPSLFVLILFSGLYNSEGGSENIEQINENGKISLAVVLDATIEINTTSVCLGESVDITFTGTDGNKPYTFEYEINNVIQPLETTNNNNSSITIQYTPPLVGSYQIELITVEDTNSNETISNESVNVTVNKPEIDFFFSNNVCSETVVQFTPNVTGNGPFDYLWSFGDTQSSTNEIPSHVYDSAVGCGNRVFNVTLAVTDSFGCSATKTKTITVKEKPILNFIDLNPGPAGDFNNCGNNSSGPEYFVEVDNANSSTCINSFNINWGDGNSQNNVSFPLSHNYLNSGTFYMVITGIGDNGCNNSITYVVKNATNPSGGITGPGNTVNLCAPTAGLQFEISGWGTNTSDTTYKIDFGDGSNIITYTQTDLISSIYYDALNPSNSLNFPIIPHSYTTTSCPTEFTLNLWIINACKTNPTPATISNIIIVKSPEAKFEAPVNGCINSSINFINSTVGGFGYECSPDSVFTWDFGDGSPTVTTNTAQNVNHVFTSNGVYNVTLTANNNFCDETTFEKEICIEPPLVPSFDLNTNNGCSPLEIITTNTTDTSQSCGGDTYLWEVFYTSDFCGIAPETWTFTNGTDENSINPSFSFETAGIYTLTLTTTNSCGSNSLFKVIEVKQPPTASLNPINDFCATASINPVAIVDACAPTSETITYTWSFPGGTPASSNQLNPGTVTYANTGNYEVTFSVTNNCGTTIVTENFDINEIPTITNTDLTQTICSGAETSEIVFTSDITNTTYTWVANVPTGVSGYIPSGTTNSIPIQTIFNSTSTASSVIYTVTPSVGGCDGSPVNFEIIINPAPEIINQPLSSSVCQNGTANELSVTFQGAGTPTYQWYENTVDNTTTGIAITGATSANFTPPTNVIDTIYYYVVITFSTGGCNEVISNTAAVEVFEASQIDSQPITPQTFCVGGNSQVLSITISGGAGTISYQWYSNTTNSSTGGTLISGATNSSYTPPTFNTIGNYYFYTEVTIDGSGCGNLSSDVAEIIVVDDPTINTQPVASQALCQNVSPQDLEVTISGGLGNISYQWYSNTVNNNTGGTLIAGATNSTYTPPTNSVGTIYYYCVITQDVSGCEAISDVSTVIVSQAPLFTAQPISDTLCLGETTATRSKCNDTIVKCISYAINLWVVIWSCCSNYCCS
jgi:PKD repeat protein